MDDRDLIVLQEVERNPTVSQRTLADRLGVALGLANAIVKRIALRGLIKIRRFKPNRLGYYLTPKGLKARGTLVLTRIKETVVFFRNAKEKASAKCQALRSQGIKNVALYGTGELAEIVFLALREADIHVQFVIEQTPAAEKWLGLPVVPLSGDRPANGVDAIVITSLDTKIAQAELAQLVGVPLVDATNWF
ncbi:MAG: winged helix-turn-helix transcriptional regulator [Planctomycetota bacterium]|nr:winged helix-turn-helix transcriptional regulator [Planctomycetota bacterium]